MPPARPDAVTTEFPHGVASGDPTSDSIVIWTTSADHVSILRWEVSTDDEFATVVASGIAEPVGRPDGGRTDRSVPVAVTVTGLPAGTPLAYRFVADGTPSPVGHASTAPRPDDPTATLRLGIACCAHLAHRPLDAYDALAERSPDLVAFIGDYIYETADEAHDPPHECVTEDDYHRRYSQYRSQSPLRDLHATAPTIAVWDDHEIVNESWATGSPADPTGSHQWQERRVAAARAFAAWMPQRSAAGPTGLDRRVRWGDVVDVVVLDARHGARERPRRDGGPSFVADSDERRILGDDQWDWLEECVDSAPGWLVLCVPTQVSPLHLVRVPDPRRGRRPRPLVNPGQWDGYPRERERLGTLLERVEGRVLVCTGDLHGRFFTGFSTPSGVAIPEVTTPSIASRPFAPTVFRRVPIPQRVLRWWLARSNPWIDEMALDVHGSTVLDVSASEITITSVDTGDATPVARLRRGESAIEFTS